nr:DUF6714 family protein [uncultured Flavobacterium sp.]
MTDQEEHEVWLLIQKEIYTAFKDVKLEDGIGYWEADAIDDYHQKDSPAYNLAKAKDERNDWTKLLITLGHLEELNYGAKHFMDTKGLCFFLPYLMTIRSSDVNYIITSALMNLKHHQKGEYDIGLLLSTEQKKCILHFYEFLISIEEPWWTEEDLEKFSDWQHLQKANNTSYRFMELMRELF